MKQVILAAHFPGVNNHTVWSDPASGSQIEFSSFVHLAKTAERGRFDFFFLADGQRLREQRGRIHDLDVVGRPDSLTVLAGLAAVTDHLGLAGTINATFNEPYDLARKLATLDHLSGGRAGWNVVTSSDAFTGENFRRGGYLDHSQRYERAEEFVRTVRELWDSWKADDLDVDPVAGTFAAENAGAFAHQGAFFDIAGRFNVPRAPQGHPLTIQAGDSDGGREFAAANADAIFSRHGTLQDGRAFYRDVKARVAAHGRSPDSLKILPGATFALGDTDAEAQENADHIRRQQVSPQTAILLLEQVWNRDLSSYDPEGPLPEIDPLVSDDSIIKGRTRQTSDPLRTAAQWRALAEEKRLGIRDLIIEVTGRQSFIGSPARVAEEINEFVQSDASDGFILVPHLTPTGLDEFVDKVVPLLQERGVLRAEYETTTLRGHLGLGESV
ncbi:NtaA/DmoA family FMN-dependent monooxygenase [Streptosporangium carneum]|uniref:Nitrilotriacetate monooxygenase component A n=1 Tax=Streptosporangium carneum TaxID=47481 RepID=A0A9W6I1M5_9ACTN|nr:NtaA/DmoA family FMN-dependent monooxygenase [Streptosporangium carneum]GLK09756.1 nitrilotriacetate monooxygenase component A [Streptosporangium carneum]